MADAAQVFSEHRERLAGVAYRVLGRVADVEDVVQDAWLRWSGVELDSVDDPEAYLVRITTRLAIDRLRSAQARREAYVGPWLPEPMLTSPDVADSVALNDSVSTAMLLVLESLSPLERAVFVLREAFDMPFGEIGEIIDASPDACRQKLSRAKRRIDKDVPRFEPDPAERHALAHSFLRAAREGDFTALKAMLAPDVVMVGDGGGKARSLPKPMVGAQPVARALATFYKIADEWGVTFHPAIVNGQPGFRSLAPDGKLVNVVEIEVADGKVQRIHSMLNPDKLSHIGLVSDLALRPDYAT
jgi:RNA polymerase sigma-70 factor, ECF subfamily